MDTLELINQIRNDGCSIVVNGSYLDIFPAKNLKLALVDQIRHNKVEILCALHQEEELTRLVNVVCNYHDFAKERHMEVLMAALSDQANAISSFAASAHKAGLLWCSTKEKTKALHEKNKDNHDKTRWH